VEESTTPQGPESPPVVGAPSAASRWGAVERGSGPPVVFLHGYPLDHAMWEPQLDTLARTHRVLLVDLPGYGLAQDRHVPDTFSEFVEDLHQTLGEALDSPAVMVCHSFGGYLGLGLYRDHPNLFAGLVLADTRSEPDSPDAREKRLSTAQRLEDAGERLNVDEVVRTLVAPATLAAGGATVESVRQMVGRAPPASVVATLRAIADRPDLGPVLSRIHVPTLVMWGTEDQLIPPGQTQSMVPRIAGSFGLPISGAGHLPSLESPAVFTDSLRSFVGGLPPWGSPTAPQP
jgi:3-oxoadipate enol-lactonase